MNLKSGHRSAMLAPPAVLWFAGTGPRPADDSLSMHEVEEIKILEATTSTRTLPVSVIVASSGKNKNRVAR
jgi:hypothetical protein